MGFSYRKTVGMASVALLLLSTALLFPAFDGGVQEHSMIETKPDLESLDQEVAKTRNSEGVQHQVESGETLWSISQRYGVSLEAICALNHKTSVQIASGEILFIPGGRTRENDGVSRGKNIRFLWPIRGEISSPFGQRWGRLHEGIDIANEEGTPVQAPKDGKVSLAAWNGGYGYAVVLDHGQNLQSIYGHLSAIYVQPGEFVRSGQVIAAVGSTGNSTGPHLHFEIRQYDQPLDPLQLLP